MTSHEWAWQHEEDLNRIEELKETCTNQRLWLNDEVTKRVALENEITRLKEGKFTKDEVHNICHNLHGTVGPEEFADGCRKEMEKLYGFCPWSSSAELYIANADCCSPERVHGHRPYRDGWKYHGWTGVQLHLPSPPRTGAQDQSCQGAVDENRVLTVRVKPYIVLAFDSVKS